MARQVHPYAERGAADDDVLRSIPTTKCVRVSTMVGCTILYTNSRARPHGNAPSGASRRSREPLHLLVAGAYTARPRQGAHDPTLTTTSPPPPSSDSTAPPASRSPAASAQSPPPTRPSAPVAEIACAEPPSESTRQARLAGRRAAAEIHPSAAGRRAATAATYRRGLLEVPQLQPLERLDASALQPPASRPSGQPPRRLPHVE